MSSIAHANNASRRAQPGKNGKPPSKNRVLKVGAIAFSLLVLAFLATFVALQVTTYSPSGIVNSYLDALSKKDAAAAIKTPGIQLGDADIANLTNASLAGLKNIEITGTEDRADGRVVVTANYTMLGLTGQETNGESTFVLQKSGKVWGIFDQWQFADNPIANVSVTVQNDWRFNLNNQQVIGQTGTASQPQPVNVLIPGIYQVEHRSNYFTSNIVEIAVTDSVAKAASLDLTPTQVFSDLISNEVHGYLTACTTQTVLQPTGCPFGKYITDPPVNAPAWTITQQPVITFEPSENGWLIPATDGIANLKVVLKSIFDGKDYDFDENIPFKVSYLIEPDENGNFNIVEQLVG